MACQDVPDISKMPDDCPKQKIVDELVSSYHEVGGINRIDCINLPSKKAIESISADLLQVIFPGARRGVDTAFVPL